MSQDLQSALEEAAAQVEAALDDLLPESDDAESRLHNAMRYAALGGGKRLRPFLVMQSGLLFGLAPEVTARVAAAVECVHTYSLVHDDLPAMDDDDLRRGKPTTHMEFDEATAILAGDALLTLAFEILAHEDTHEDPYIRCNLVAALAKAAGAHGMVAGQMIDLAVEHEDPNIGTVTRLQRLKTGELIAFASVAGAIMGKASRPARHALESFAHDLGLAFQMADDLIDLESTPAESGKATGKDEGRGKATFVGILGPERARAQAQLLADQAARHLDLFDEKADLLRAVAGFVVNRRS